MATPKQTAAAENAAKHSTGPKSPEGRTAVSFNRITHGLCSKKIILPGEDPEAFHKLLADFMSDLKPVDIIERTMVQQMAESYWRLNRARGIESSTFEIEARMERAYLRKLGKDPDLCGPDELYSLVIRNAGKQFELLRRYEGSIERSYYKAIKEFQAYRSARLKRNQPVTETKRFESQNEFRPAHFPGESPKPQTNPTPAAAQNPHHTPAASQPAENDTSCNGKRRKPSSVARHL